MSTESTTTINLRGPLVDLIFIIFCYHLIKVVVISIIGGLAWLVSLII